ncbi:MAG: hypothetical protein AAFQ63_11225 [Cyanobacteria bacterium J06621_11]
MTHSLEKSRPIDDVIKRILEALKIPVKIANQTVDSILMLMWINIASAIWLGFFLWHGTNLHIIFAAIVTPIISLPAWVLAKFYFTLQEIMGLPQKITDFSQTAKDKASELGEAHKKIKARTKKRKVKFSDLISVGKYAQFLLALGKRLRDWIFLAKRLREVKALFNEVEELSALTAGAMLLTNPLFMVAMIAAVVITSTWAIVALVTIIIYAV